jgi:hypothetical protein
MKWLLNILGVVFVVVGVIWILQGSNILPGSFMTGQTEWAVYGAIAVLIGFGNLAMARKLGRPRL